MKIKYKIINLILILSIYFTACKESPTTISLPECEVTDSVITSEPAADEEQEGISITALTEIFGSTFYNKEKDKFDGSILKADIIGVYFSAEWCPPCRSFTPRLIKTYNELKNEGKRFEIIFVSSDRTEIEMFKYMNGYNMPWYAVEHNGPSARQLVRRYSIRAYPTLIIVDSDGNTISRNGVMEVNRKGVNVWADYFVCVR